MKANKINKTAIKQITQKSIKRNMINDNKSDMIPFMSSFSATRKARLIYDRL